MQKILPYILVFLLTLLPFHAFLVTSGNHFFVFPKIWKELLILIIIFGIGYHVLKNKKLSRKLWRNLDSIDWLILGFSTLALCIALINFSENSLTSFIYGVKYTLFPLWIFFVFRHMPEEVSEKFLIKFWKVFPVFSGVLIFSGIIFFALAQKSPEFFELLGYSTDHSFHSIFQPLSYCQKISFTEICRAQGVFSGPNQMGAYFIFLTLLVGTYCIRPKKNGKTDTCNTSLQKKIFTTFFIVSLILLLLTFSRSAWIGGFFAGIFFLFFYLKDLKNLNTHNTFLQKKIKIIILGITISPFLLAGLLFIIAPEISNKIINRVSSSSDHYELSLHATKNIIENPLGQGLGTAGAASKYDSEKGKKEVGLVPENWYLQIGIETGILGIIFWILIIFFVVKKLIQKNIQKNLTGLETKNFNLSLASAIFGISIMGIFLHSWESSAVAYTVWGFAGILLTKEKNTLR